MKTRDICQPEQAIDQEELIANISSQSINSSSIQNEGKDYFVATKKAGKQHCKENQFQDLLGCMYTMS